MRGLFLGFGLLYSLIAWSQLDVQLSPNPALYGQEIKFIVKQSQVNGHVAPDISILQKDFDIIGSQESMSYQVINGQSFRENIWTIILVAKHPGKIHLPILDFNGEKTPSLSIDIGQANQASSPLQDDGRENVYMTWDITPKQALLHQKIELNLKIYHTLPLLDARLNPPQVNNALLFTLEDSSQQLEVIGGKRYQVENSKFVIYPQKEGRLKIKAPVLDALEYGMMPNPIHKTVAPKYIQVDALPAGVELAKWLPADDLTYQELKPLSPHIGIALGESISRRIKITAQGIPAQLMPELKVNCGPHCKIYINPAKIDNQMLGGQLYGSKTYDISYIPQITGSQKLADIDIPWFNNRAQKQAVLTIPGISIDVFKAHHQSQASPQKASANEKNWTVLYILLSFIFGGICVYGMRFISWAMIRDVLEKNRGIRRACQTGDLAKLRCLLLVWAKKKLIHVKILDLNDILPYIDDEAFKTQILGLSECLYRSHNQNSFDFQKFWLIFKNFKGFKLKKRNNKTIKQGLNP